MSLQPKLLITGELSGLNFDPAELFQREFSVETFLSGSNCVKRCLDLSPEIILLDLYLPDMDGIETCRQLRDLLGDTNTQILVIGQHAEEAKRLAAFEVGADDFLSNTFSDKELFAKVAVLRKLHQAIKRARTAEAKIHQYNSELERVADARAQAVQSTQDIAVFALAKLADSRDNETGEHLIRMRAYSQFLADDLAKNGPYQQQIDTQFLDDLYRSSPLHDIGKVGISDSILTKPGKLTDEEYEIMKTHAMIGADTLKETADSSPSGSFFYMAAQIARHHHERWDGNGYPDKIAGLDIPLPARIVAVADVFDALTSKRVYKRAFSIEEAKEIIQKDSGKHFDPAVVEAFERCLHQFVKIAKGNLTEADMKVKRACKLPRYRVGVERGTILQKEHEKVLIIDDDPSILRILDKWLSDAGYEVIAADNGATALNLIEEHTPRYVLTDWNMDGLNGEAVCKWIREQAFPHYIYTMVITADERPDTQLKAYHSGADDILAKPLKKDQLLARLKSASRVIELENQLQCQTRNDPLTGLATKRYLEEQLQREWQRAIHYRSALSCILIDIDSFREINEKEGSAVGDQVVRKFAEILKSNTKVTDYFCRLEGDRFLLVRSESNESLTMQYAEHLRLLIESTKFEVGEREISPTVSLGVAQTMTDTQDLDQLIQLAEQSIVVAKQLGGNRVINRTAFNYGETEELSRAIGSNPLTKSIAVDIMSSPIRVVQDVFTAQQTSQFLIEHNLNSAPVVDHSGKLIGVISEKDILKCLLCPSRWEQPITSLLSRDVVAFEETESAEVIYNFLLKAAIRRVIIVRNDEPVGVISRGSLLRWFTEINTQEKLLQSKLKEDQQQIGLIDYLDDIRRIANPDLESLAAFNPVETPS